MKYSERHPTLEEIRARLREELHRANLPLSPDATNDSPGVAERARLDEAAMLKLLEESEKEGDTNA